MVPVGVVVEGVGGLGIMDGPFERFSLSRAPAQPAGHCAPTKEAPPPTRMGYGSTQGGSRCALARGAGWEGTPMGGGNCGVERGARDKKSRVWYRTCFEALALGGLTLGGPSAWWIWHPVDSAPSGFGTRWSHYHRWTGEERVARVLDGPVCMENSCCMDAGRIRFESYWACQYLYFIPALKIVKSFLPFNLQASQSDLTAGAISWSSCLETALENRLG